jgi:ferredoxin
MARPLFVVELIKRTFPYLLPTAKLTRLRGVGAAAEKALFDGDDIMFLVKDRTIEVGAAAEDKGSMVLPSSVVEHFIEEAKDHWIMDKCICRDALSCKDFPVGLGCLFLGEAALGINPKLGRRVSREDALAHARKCREAGLVHLIGRNKLDTVWLGVGPGTRLLTICNCCPCCCLWRMIPVVKGSIAEKVTRMPGVEVKAGEDCTGCGKCAEICFVKAVDLTSGRAKIGDECRGCGRCAEVCPEKNIHVSISPDAVSRAVARIEGLVELA